jgi:hypothetical protein
MRLFRLSVMCTYRIHVISEYISCVRRPHQRHGLYALFASTLHTTAGGDVQFSRFSSARGRRL